MNRWPQQPLADLANTLTFFRWLLCLSGLAICRLAVADEQATLPENVVRVLQKHCHECHLEQNQKGGLRLDGLSGILAGGESGEVIDLQHRSESVLLEKIISGEMPPDDRPPISDEETEIIRNWILDDSRWSHAGDESATANSLHEVYPILLRRCIVCHGRHRQEGQVDLRTLDSAMKGGQSGQVIVPGDPEKSRLVQKIRSGAMPPHDRLVEVSVKPIEPREMDVLTEWIKSGAKDFVPEPPKDMIGPIRWCRKVIATSGRSTAYQAIAIAHPPSRSP